MSMYIYSANVINSQFTDKVHAIYILQKKEDFYVTSNPCNIERSATKL